MKKNNSKIDLTIILVWTYNVSEYKNELQERRERDLILLGEKIRQKRVDLGMSQYELADRVKKLNQSQISKIESGNRCISVENLLEISKALGVSINKLLENKEET